MTKTEDSLISTSQGPLGRGEQLKTGWFKLKMTNETGNEHKNNKQTKVTYGNI